MNELIDLETLARTYASDLQAEVRKAMNSIERPWYQNNWKRLQYADRILTCAADQLGKLGFKCHSNDTRCEHASAFIYWKFDHSIRLCDDFWYGSKTIEAAILLHEATHKCGTVDATYFGTGSPPRSTFGIGWNAIADTYFYWAYYGFCIPGEDC